MKVFQKQPRDVLDYDVDMSAWFAGIPGDDIQSVSVSISALSETIPALVVGSPVHSATPVLLGSVPVSFKVWLSGGTDYEDYVVTCLVTTEQDRTKEVEFKLKVRDL
jgi:hypothetical protein